ncbi:MAG: hypothetical protein IJ620_05935 [Bacteroidales bacterium]|nr:hypothetical protein [Bacteroidales bacterium]
MRKTFIILTILLLTLPLNAQYIRLTDSKKKGALYLNTDRVFNFNRYEGIRLEATLYAVYPNDNHELARKMPYQWQFSAFGGIGTQSHTVSYGGSIALQQRHKHRWRPAIAYSHDLHHAGSTSLEDYHLLNIANNAVYATDHYTMADIITLSVQGRPLPFLAIAASASHSLERNLFDTDGILLYDNHAITPLRQYSDLNLRATLYNHTTLNLHVGKQHLGNSQPFIQAIVQYNKVHTISPLLSLDTYLQAGASSRVPYSRLFDISGTWNLVMFFNHTMLTVAPNEFHGHLYARATLTLSATHALYQWTYSAPVPFLQLGALAGWLIDHDGPTGSAIVDGFSLTAPSHGLLEPAIGCHSILRWGLVDLGLAAALRLAPPHTPYHHHDPDRNYSIMGTVTLKI